MELPAQDVCYRALESRDPRFDGLIFVGISSTGVYCRPVCPARTPHLRNCEFFASAAAAQSSGYRPCLRCRPETAPDLAAWRGTSNTVSRAMGLIAEGALDGSEQSVAGLAERLGVGERHLRRLFLQHLGASPLTVAQTRRVLFAKQLLHETRLPMTAVAQAAGFGSVRRFHETFHDMFHRPPSALRRKSSAGDAQGETKLRLRYRPPYDWESLIEFLRARAISGVELVENSRYWRTIEWNGAIGSLAVAHLPRRDSVEVSIRFPEVGALPAIVDRVRRLFDLAADITTINGHLSSDPVLAPLIAQRPGLRTPGGWDSFEVAVRAVLGQQISVAAARTLAGRLTELHGRPVPVAYRIRPELTRTFPSARRLASVQELDLPMPAARIAAVRAIAQASLADPHLFRSGGDLDETISRLRSIRGVGEWTAQYIALRALREPDAFPVTDLGLLRGVAAAHGEMLSQAELLHHAERWRPWRAYAAQHLWAADATREETVPPRVRRRSLPLARRQDQSTRLHIAVRKGTRT